MDAVGQEEVVAEDLEVAVVEEEDSGEVVDVVEDEVSKRFNLGRTMVERGETMRQDAGCLIEAARLRIACYL